MFNDIDPGMIASGIIALADHAWSKQVSNSATMIPRAAKIWCLPVQMLYTARGVQEPLNLDMWHLYKYTENYESIDAGKTPYIPLADPFECFDFNFSSSGLKPVVTTLKKETRCADHEIDIIANGTLNGMIFWTEMELDAHRTINMCPGYCPENPLHYQQAFQCMEPINLTTGDVLPLQCEHSISDIKFAVDQGKLPNYAERKGKFPLYDGRLVVATQKMQDQFKKLTEGATFNKEVHETSVRTAIQIAMDPAAYEGGSVDPGRASMLAMSLFP